MAHDTDDGPSFEDLTARANALAATGKRPSLEQETALRSAIEKLFDHDADAAPADSGNDSGSDDGGE